MTDHGLFQEIGNGLSVGCQLRRLIHYADTLQVFFYLKSFGVASFEIHIKFLGRFLARYTFGQYRCIFQIIQYDGRCTGCGMGESRFGLLMFWFAMDHDTVTFGSDLLTSVPNFFYKRTGSIVFLYGYSFVAQKSLHFQCGSEGRNDHNVVAGHGLERDQLFA